MAKHYISQRDYHPIIPVETELQTETCDLYGNFGDPSGAEHHVCLDELFEGNGFQIKNVYKRSSLRKSE